MANDDKRSGFELRDEEWNYHASRDLTTGRSAQIPTTIRKGRISCTCGHSWLAFEGKGAGRIETLSGNARVICPACGASGSIPITDVRPWQRSDPKLKIRPNLPFLTSIAEAGRLRLTKESDDDLQFEVSSRLVRRHARAGYVTILSEERDPDSTELQGVECELTVLGREALDEGDG